MSDMNPQFGQADLTTCDREPIHIPGSIQPHGVLLVVDREDFSIQQYAGDTRFMIGVEPNRLSQVPLPALFDQNTVLLMAQRLHVPHTLVLPTVIFGISARTGALPLDATIHACANQAFIELEPARRSITASGDPLAQVKTMLAALSASNSVEETCEVAAHQVRETIGFDRVSVYRFLPDGSGVVIAEDRGDAIEGFLGLHFPISDIPQQARELYRRNWLRAIPDIYYEPAPLQGCANGAGSPLDMSYCTLRSVSPIHIEYLRNMGVTASMSLSLVIGGELWGLIACHNYSPRYLPSDLRVACELFAQICSLQIEARNETDAARRRMVPRTVQGVLSNRVPLASHIGEELVTGEVSVQDLVPSTGVAVCFEGRVLTRGNTPPPTFIEQLAAWLGEQSASVFQTHELSKQYLAAEPYQDIASGLLSIFVSRDPLSYVMWFRPEVARTVTWAGNPDKAVEFGLHGARLTPRKSFEAWQAEVRGQAEPWDEVDLDAVNSFRVWLLETVLLQLDLARREREVLFARQSDLMAELDHRVKNTLANIHALVQQTKTQSSSVEEFIENLESRIRAMAHAHNLLSETHWEGASIRSMIEQELAPFADSGGANVRLSGRDWVLTPTAAMAFNMVLHELTTNAAKYGSLSVPEGTVDVRWDVDPASGNLLIHWKELGGPPVAPPTRRSFGSVVIERSLRHELKGSCVLQFAPDGVACEAVIPAAHLVRADKGV
ncbi:MAG: GAF domain-containing protein [Gammaproteobacteria bacterium]|nr:GAF domain-containing protein [Gammaproteobacteria bacterium]